VRVINCARGGIYDEEALYHAIVNGKVAGAALDVYEDEPDLTPGLETLDNVVLLPHMGSATHQTRRRMGAMAVENLMAGLAGRLPPNCLNPEVL
jgi:glyoxylate reductase